MHGGEDSSRGGLQWHVEVLGEARGRREECDEVASHVEWFDRAQAEASYLCFVEYLPEEIEKILAWGKVAAPGASIDAAEDDFFVARVGEIADFLKDGFQSKTAAFSPDERDNAERAAVVAAVLDF